MRRKGMQEGTKEIIFHILRRESANSPSYWQKIPYLCRDESETVAFALEKINQDPDYLDLNGKKVGTIRWQRSCLQKKCGACAMVINNRPSLACDTFLREARKRNGVIVVEPLRKFPVIGDLLVDRSILFENLRTMQLWMKDGSTVKKEDRGEAYEASRCLQCGCCLEVCPNFMTGGEFFGAASFVPTTRLITELPKGEREELSALYRRHAYDGCGKALSCKKVCPAGIDTAHMLVQSNALAVWRQR